MNAADLTVWEDMRRRRTKPPCPTCGQTCHRYMAPSSRKARRLARRARLRDALRRSGLPTPRWEDDIEAIVLGVFGSLLDLVDYYDAASDPDPKQPLEIGEAIRYRALHDAEFAYLVNLVELQAREIVRLQKYETVRPGVGQEVEATAPIPPIVDRAGPETPPT